MNALRQLIFRGSWPAAVLASLVAHLVVLTLGMRTVHTADGNDHRPPRDQQKLRGSSPIPVALLTARSAHEQEVASEPAAQAIQRIGRRRGHPYAAMPGPAPVLAHNADHREAAAPPDSKSVLGGAPPTEDTYRESSSVGEQGHSPGASGEISSSESGSVGQGGSRGLATTPERIAELHQRLVSSAQRCYPPAARRLRLRGEVGLHFCLGADGFAASRSLRGSTGSALLDRASLDCVLAGALPAPGMVGCYDVQVRFSDDH